MKKIIKLVKVSVLVFIALSTSLMILINYNWSVRRNYIVAKKLLNGELSKMIDLPRMPFIRNNTNKVILYWDTFFDKKDMGFGFGMKPFEKCPVKNCFATDDKNYMPVEEFDAVIFHGARYNVYSNGIPERRKPHQKYIFYSLESYFNTHFERQVSKNFYNWTMTFKRNSDIHSPYAIIVKQETNYTLPSENQVKDIKKKVAWLVSNCFTTHSKIRLRYALELEKYIPVQTYGDCVHNKWYKTKAELLENNYKFYLAFENSMCEDYVTEKLFDAMKLNVVPIVFGMSNYNDIVPPNSVIDTRHFASPKHLAQYLNELDQNITKYLEYFEWKKHYIVELDTSQYTMCQLCKKLHQPLDYSYYEDIEDWYKGFWCLS